jgi:hypothetical protein
MGSDRIAVSSQDHRCSLRSQGPHDRLGGRPKPIVQAREAVAEGWTSLFAAVQTNDAVARFRPVVGPRSSGKGRPIADNSAPPEFLGFYNYFWEALLRKLNHKV